MKILILLTTMIFSLTAFAEADWFSPGCVACTAMQKNAATLGNKRGVCNTAGCGTKAKGRSGKPSGPAGVSN